MPSSAHEVEQHSIVEDPGEEHEPPSSVHELHSPPLQPRVQV